MSDRIGILTGGSANHTTMQRIPVRTRVKCESFCLADKTGWCNMTKKTKIARKLETKLQGKKEEARGLKCCCKTLRQLGMNILRRQCTEEKLWRRTMWGTNNGMQKTSKFSQLKQWWIQELPYCNGEILWHLGSDIITSHKLYLHWNIGVMSSNLNPVLILRLGA